MVKRTAIILIPLIFSAVIFTGCSKNKEDNNNCIQYEVSPVTRIDGPHTASINEVIDLTLTYGVASGCGQFDHIEETNHSNTRTINVVGKYTGCACTLVYREEQLTYNFQAATAGTYYLEFYQDPGTTLKDTIVVQ